MTANDLVFGVIAIGIAFWWAVAAFWLCGALFMWGRAVWRGRS